MACVRAFGGDGSSRFLLSQSGVTVTVTVAPDALTKEADVTVTGGGVIVVVTVEAMGEEIVLGKGVG